MSWGVGELLARGRTRVLVFCWLGWVFDFYDLILFAFLKRDIAASLSLDLQRDLPVIDGVTLFATAVGGFAFGRLADRWGRRRALTLSILVYSAGAFATAFAGGYASLLLARVITGIGVGGEWGVGHAIVAETYPSRLRGRAAGALQAGSPVAMGLAAAIASFSGLPWQTLFQLAGAPALLVVFARWAIPGEDRAPGRAAGRLLDLFRGRLRRPSSAILTLLVLHMTGFWCTYAWLPQHLLSDLGATASDVGWFFVAVNSVHVIADLSFGFLADRFGRKRMFFLSCLFFAGGLWLVTLGYDSLRGNLWALGGAIALVGMGAGTWSCFGVLFAENYPAQLRATAAAGFYNLSRGAQLLTQIGMRSLFAWSGTFAVALHVGALMAVLSAIAIWWVPHAEGHSSRPPEQ